MKCVEAREENKQLDLGSERVKDFEQKLVFLLENVSK